MVLCATLLWCWIAVYASTATPSRSSIRSSYLPTCRVSLLELADSVVQATGGTVLKENDGTYMVGPEYWAGWVLAYYQWLSCRSFTYMHKKGLGISEVVAMYYPLHEADLSRFAAAADDIILRNKS